MAREMYTQWNVEIQRKERRDKKAFLNEQCKEIEENSKMENSRNSSRKWEISREHYMDGHDKNRNSKDLTEVDDIEKR